MTILLRAYKSYPLLRLSSVAEKIYLKGILSDLTLSNEALCDVVAGFPLLLMPAGYSGGGKGMHVVEASN